MGCRPVSQLAGCFVSSDGMLGQGGDSRGTLKTSQGQTLSGLYPWLGQLGAGVQLVTVYERSERDRRQWKSLQFTSCSVGAQHAQLKPPPFTPAPDIASTTSRIGMQILASCPQGALGAGQAPSATRQPHRAANAALHSSGVRSEALQRVQAAASSSSTPTDLRGRRHQRQHWRRAGRQRASVVVRCVGLSYAGRGGHWRWCGSMAARSISRVSASVQTRGLPMDRSHKGTRVACQCRLLALSCLLPGPLPLLLWLRSRLARSRTCS